MGRTFAERKATLEEGAVTSLIDRTTVPVPLEVAGVVAVPSLEEIERLTSVPDRRVVYRRVGWAFYEALVDSIPESSRIHVDFDGKDVEVMVKGWDHEGSKHLLGRFVEVVAEVLEIPCRGLGETTWKRPQIARGLEADECYLVLPEKLVAVASARARGSRDLADIPNPDLAIEVDISVPQTDRAGIYAALGVSEVWRFVGGRLVIDRLRGDGRYEEVESSKFLPVTAAEVTRWVVDEDSSDESAWARRWRMEIGANRSKTSG
jgi:Uma2 family endonuclease